MLLTRRNCLAFATIEYIALLTFVLAAILVAGYYVTRAQNGRWKAAGDTFGAGRQFDPRSYGVRGSGGGTLECIYNGMVWKDARCYDACIDEACRIACPAPADCN
jgi:hypothetical protein